MEFEAVKWIMGALTTLVLAIIGGFYRLGSKVSTHHGEIHGRIDRIKDDYVRRDDFEKHMERQDSQGAKIEFSIRKLDEKIERLIAFKCMKKE